MTRGLLLPLLAMLLVAPALPAAPEPTPTHSVLAGTPELEKPVTLSEMKIPVGELLKRVGGATGVHLIATGPAADEPVAVVVTEMPALRLLEELAAFLDYSWVREDANGEPAAERGYRLYQTGEQLKRERTLFARARQNEQERLRLAVASYAEVGKLSDTEYAAARETMDRRAAQPPPLTPAEELRRRALRACNNVATRQLAQLIGGLTGNDWGTLQAGRSLRFYSRPAAGERALPENMVQRLSAFRPSTKPSLQQYVTGRDGLRPGDSLEQRREYVQKQDDAWAQAASLQVVMRMDRQFRGAYRVDAPVLDVHVWPVGDQGGLASNSEAITIWIDPVTTQRGWSEDSVEPPTELEHDPVLNRQQPFRPAVRPLRTENGTAYFGQVPRLFPELARTYGVSLLADAYSTAPCLKPEQATGAGPTSLRAVLGRLGENYYRIERHNDLVLQRSRSWFYERPAEIPVRLTRRWDELFQRFGCLPLDHYLEAVGALSDAQFDALCEARSWAVFPAAYSDLCLDRKERDGFRLLRLLNLQQRRRLDRGESISFAELNAVQRERFLALLDDDNTFRAASISPRDLAAGGIHLNRTPAHLFRREDPGGIFYRQWLFHPETDVKSGPILPPGPEAGRAGKEEQFDVQAIELLLRCGSSEVGPGSRLVAR